MKAVCPIGYVGGSHMRVNCRRKTEVKKAFKEDRQVFEREISPEIGDFKDNSGARTLTWARQRC